MEVGFVVLWAIWWLSGCAYVATLCDAFVRHFANLPDPHRVDYPAGILAFGCVYALLAGPMAGLILHGSWQGTLDFGESGTRNSDKRTGHSQESGKLKLPAYISEFPERQSEYTAGRAAASGPDPDHVKNMDSPYYRRGFAHGLQERAALARGRGRLQ